MILKEEDIKDSSLMEWEMVMEAFISQVEATIKDNGKII
jgi:hypothetical protein